MNKSVAINFDIDTIASDLLLKIRSPQQIKEIRNISYSKIIPRILEILSEVDIKATFFIIGKDALDVQNHTHIMQIVKHGHEIANHSYSHDRNLLNYNENDFCNDILSANKILEDITQKKITGFRMPGCTINSQKLNLLKKLGFIYDSSINISLLYNFSKLIFNKISKTKNSIPYMKLKKQKLLKHPYFSDEKNIFNASNNKNSIIEFPITNLCFINYFMRKLNLKVSLPLLSYLKTQYHFINYICHDHEFAEERDFCAYKFQTPFYNKQLNKDLKIRLSIFKNTVKKLKKDFDFVTLSGYCHFLKENHYKTTCLCHE